MEIVYLANCVLPSRSANTIQITNMCQAFAALGHDVTLLVPAHPDAEAEVDDVYEFYDVDPRFEIRKLPRPNLSSAGTLVVNVRMGRTAAGMDPDLVYGRTTVGCYVASRSGAPTVFESHAPEEEARFGRVERLFFDRMVGHDAFEYLVVISEALRGYYRERYPSLADRIVVARDAAEIVDESTEPVDLDAVGSRETTGGREGTRDRDGTGDPDGVQDRAGVRDRDGTGARGGVGERSRTGDREGGNDRRVDRDGEGLDVGYVGHLYQGRGMDVIGELARRLPGERFHVIGGDPEDVARWEAELDDVDNVTFYGFLPPGDLDAYRLAFDVQLAPYQRDLETNAGHNTVRWMSPLKIFEYMAAGRAIVASDLPAIREILDDDRTALLCEPADVDEWAAALRRLRDDTDLRARLGERARAEFLADYTYEERARICLREREEASAAAPGPA